MTASTGYAKQINRLHRKSVRHAQQAVLNARAAGELLNLAKQSMLHGTWTAWLEANFSETPRAARNYMKIARMCGHILRKTETVADLTVREALRLARYGQGGAHEPPD